MDVAGAWKFRISRRSSAPIILLVALLAPSVFWNLRQHRLIEQNRMAAQRQEAARAKEEAERAEARVKRNAKWAASDAHARQLYREIDNLSQINERLLSQSQRSMPKKPDNSGETDGSP